MPQANDEHGKAQRRIARQYTKLGYEVIENPGPASLPSFLRGFSPDLLATKDGDHVVIEIKSSDSLRGSNELTELATIVAQRPDWRFEFVAIESSRLFWGHPGPRSTICCNRLARHSRRACTNFQ
jgi:hypothetical protein